MAPRERQARLGCDVRFAAAADGEESTSDVEVLAYTGGIVNVGYGPEVLDLAGLEVAPSHPLLVDHDPERVAGWATGATNDGKSLTVPGKLLVGEGEEEGRRVRARAKAGFPWQASMGWQVLEDEFVPAGQSRTVNGQLLQGPFLHDKRCRLGEVSFVSRGADSNTRVKAASASNPKETHMDPVMAERQRVKDIKAAFPDDREFADQYIEAGSTLADAKVAYADRAAAKLKEANEKVAAAEKKAAEAAAALEAEKKSKAPSSTHVPAVRPAGERGPAPEGEAPKTARERWDAKVREAKGKGLDREAAVKQAARDNPELHREMLAEVNPGKQEPAYRAGRK